MFSLKGKDSKTNEDLYIYPAQISYVRQVGDQIHILGANLDVTIIGNAKKLNENIVSSLRIDRDHYPLVAYNIETKKWEYAKHK